MEWDEVVPLAAAAYNFFPCQAARESPFVLMFSRDPITPFAKLLEPAPRYWGDRGGHIKMDLLKKLYLLTAENVKRAREGQNPTEITKQENNFKVNDLVLVRDVTSEAFALRYMPNYRIVEIHGPNRIVVRDGKGIESVRRSSHLKVCELKDKIAATLPDIDEYRQFGRNTKLLLHPKDVPDLQFSSKTEKKGEILPEVEISMVNVMPKQKISSSTDLTKRSGEILPDKSVKMPVINANSEYIIDCMRELKKHGEIPPEMAAKEETDKLHETRTWFQNPVTCVSKWSKALKMGVVYSMGLDPSHTATMDPGENDKT